MANSALVATVGLGHGKGASWIMVGRETFGRGVRRGQRPAPNG
jgi:hypothetical protein